MTSTKMLNTAGPPGDKLIDILERRLGCEIYSIGESAEVESLRWSARYVLRIPFISASNVSVITEILREEGLPNTVAVHAVYEPEHQYRNHFGDLETSEAVVICLESEGPWLVSR